MLFRVQAPIILGLIASACGPTRRQLNQRTLDTIQPNIYSPHPPAAFLTDGGCQAEAGSSQVDSVQVWSWDGLQTVRRTVPLHASFGTTATTAAVGKTTWQDVYLRRCDVTLPGGGVCNGIDGQPERWLQQAPGKPLRICPNDPPQRQSYETVAAESLYFIQNAYDFYAAATASQGTPAPAPIDLLVLPEFISDFTHVKKDGKDTTVRTYMTDNLAYFPGSGLIGVFPIQATEQPTLPGYFWESAFVLGHEYGHHIDFTRHGHVLASVGLRWDPLTHSYSDDIAQAAGASPASDRAQIAGAEAEAFADLLGFYASGADGKAIIGLPFIGYNRNVKNGQFADREPKILTKDHLNILLGRSKFRPTTIDYGDVHTIGAIIAYTTDQVFTSLTARAASFPAGSPAEIKARYRLALGFMDTLTKETANLAATASGAQVLTPLGLALEAATSQFSDGLGLRGDDQSRLQQQVCKLTKQLLPALDTLPFAIGGSC